MDLQGKIFGAVNDIAAIDWDMHRKHSIPDEFLYFNSGVLLIDKKQWLAGNATAQVFDYLKKNHSLCDYHDQDGLNGALFSKRYNLSPVWNQQIGIYFIDKDVGFLVGGIQGLHLESAADIFFTTPSLPGAVSATAFSTTSLSDGLRNPK